VLHHPIVPNAINTTTTGLYCVLPLGSTASSFEQVLVSYLSMLVREMFIRMFFIRTFVLDGLLKETRRLIVNYESNPNNIMEIR